MSHINQAVLKLAQENPEFRTALVAELKVAGSGEVLKKQFFVGFKDGQKSGRTDGASAFEYAVRQAEKHFKKLKDIKNWFGPLGMTQGISHSLEEAQQDMAYYAGMHFGQQKAQGKTALDKSTPRNVSKATMDFSVALGDVIKAGKKLQRLFKKHPVIDPDSDWGRGEAAERKLAKVLDLLKKWQRATPMLFGVYADSPMHRQGADKWKKKPKGWTDESRKKFWNTLTSAAPKHKVTECIKRMDKHMGGNAGAFCASLADRVIPGWREEAAKDKKKASLTQPLSLRRDYGASDDEWLDQEEVRKHCPPCADKMAANSIRKVKASTLRLAMQRR